MDAKNYNPVMRVVKGGKSEKGMTPSETLVAFHLGNLAIKENTHKEYLNQSSHNSKATRR